MENTQIEKLLTQSGFSHLEIQCYLALLKKSPQRAGALAKRLEVPKATILDSLQRLSDELNIVKRTKTKNYYLFLVEDPSDLVRYLLPHSLNF